MTVDQITDLGHGIHYWWHALNIMIACLCLLVLYILGHATHSVLLSGSHERQVSLKIECTCLHI